MKASNNISKNLAEDERKRQESKKRSGAESKLEKKRFEGLKKLGGKLIQPVKGPLEKLFNFIKTIILGKILLGILDWLGDPQNQKKLQKSYQILQRLVANDCYRSITVWYRTRWVT